MGGILIKDILTEALERAREMFPEIAEEELLKEARS